MKKRYLAIAILFIFSNLLYTKAYKIDTCDVLISYKLSSSQDMDSYMCRNADYMSSDKTIAFNKKNKTVSLNNVHIYSMQIFSEDIKFEISGKNSISILLLNGNLQIEGKGSLKFKEGSFVKKVENGKPVYQFVYNNSVVLTEEKIPFVGTVEDFETAYPFLKEGNKLPETFSLNAFQLIQESDYSKMTSLSINQNWLDKHVDTLLETNIVDGYAEIYFADKRASYQLESENAILLSNENVDSKYNLVVNTLEDVGLTNKIENKLEDTDLLRIFDVSVYKGKNLVAMQNGNYTIKIKMFDDSLAYDDYQVVYINDDGEIEEYLDAFLDNEYIVFSTSHLSQYGIVAKNQNLTTSPVNSKQNNKINYTLLIFFLFILFFLFAYISIIAIKFRQFSKKRRKR